MKSRTEDETTSISKRDEKLSDEIEQYNVCQSDLPFIIIVIINRSCTEEKH